MVRARFGNSLAVAACLLCPAAAQDEAETCYGPGSVAGAVAGTLVVSLALFSTALFLYNMYWKNRKGKHLVLMTDAENPNDQYAFDNPCFREATPIKQSVQDEKATSKLEKNKWLGWTPLHSFGKDHKPEKITSADDSCVNNPRLKIVTLKSHDFTGLGFNICGNMRDGIFIKDVLHRGPAFESGCINSGDRIDSVCINFRNMVFEDALMILSYASPYDVQVQVESDSYSRPSTLIRSKRESNAVSSAERIFHPKYNRSQSISHLNEIGKSNNKKMTHQIGFMQEKNRINQSLNKSQEFHGSPNEYPTIKVSAASNIKKEQKTETSKQSPMVNSKKYGEARETEPQQTKAPSGDPQNKLHKFGIKVLPVSMNPKMGVQSVTKKPAKSPSSAENEVSFLKEKPEKAAKPKPQNASPRSSSPLAESGSDEPDANKENTKGMLAKSFQNLKEKINQNPLGRKKSREGGAEVDEESGRESGALEQSEVEALAPKPRSAVACGVKAYQQNQQNHLQGGIPEEVSRAGDVARNNRKSTSEPAAGRRKSNASLVAESVVEGDKNKKLENGSESESSSDRDSSRMADESKKPKRSKGKAPVPPGVESSKSPKPSTLTFKEINEIKKESELVKDEKMSIFEPKQDTVLLKEIDDEKDGDDVDEKENHQPTYESDSDSEPIAADPKESPSNTKIELNATQVTIHQSPSGDGNEEECEPSRKAASLGDLSKLDSEQPLSIVLERAVSLDLTEGSSQCGKKRKAPLPPSEEFPAVFDDLNYRKEPRLENSLGLNTFQRRLKKSSDFGTLEDALYEGPKSLEIEVKHGLPMDLTEAHNYNIQEFSSWLAECRRPKFNGKESPEEPKPSAGSTSLVNINSSEEGKEKPQFEYQGVSFSVNGKNFPEFEKTTPEPSVNFPGGNSRTVVVISQPNSLEPTILDNYSKDDMPEPANGRLSAEGAPSLETTLEDATPPKLPTTPMPVMSTCGTPLTSSLTYITEIKVSTSEPSENASEPPEFASPSGDGTIEIEPISTPISSRSESVREKIEKFDVKPSLAAKEFSSKLKANDGVDGNDYARKENHSVLETSRIPIRTMKSETGQKVLATIQSLAAKETSPSKTPEVEYAKRVASLFSGNGQPQQNQPNIRKENESGRPNVSGLYFQGSPPKPSKDYSPTRKVPPVVPPRKLETSLTTKSTVTVELPGKTQPQERNIVTFSAFGSSEDPESPSRISLKIKDPGEMNGKEGVTPVRTTATKIVFERKESKEGL